MVNKTFPSHVQLLKICQEYSLKAHVQVLSLVKFWEWYFFRCNYFVVLVIISGFFVHVIPAQPSILTVVTIILDDYLKTNPGVKDWP